MTRVPLQMSSGDPPIRCVLEEPPAENLCQGPQIQPAKISSMHLLDDQPDLVTVEAPSGVVPEEFRLSDEESPALEERDEGVAYSGLIFEDEQVAAVDFASPEPWALGGGTFEDEHREDQESESSRMIRQCAPVSEDFQSASSDQPATWELMSCQVPVSWEPAQSIQRLDALQLQLKQLVKADAACWEAMSIEEGEDRPSSDSLRHLIRSADTLSQELAQVGKDQADQEQEEMFWSTKVVSAEEVRKDLNAWRASMVEEREPLLTHHHAVASISEMVCQNLVL